jgi:type VI secretion system protein ImpM
MNLASDVASIPGWYGKLPSLGDFASRRLEADFIEPWDLWLGEGMQAQRDAFGERWLDAYLQSPAWRFILMPGVLPDFDPRLVVVGVLMPSVDRVGRYFPLTIAASVATAPTSGADYEGLLDWLHRLEDTALDALQQDWTIEQLEHALAGLASPSSALQFLDDRLWPIRQALNAALRGAGGFVAMQAAASRGDLACVLAGVGREQVTSACSPSQATTSLTGVGLWIAETPGQPQVLLSKGLPGLSDFVGMFSGGAGSVAGGETRSAEEGEGAAMRSVSEPAIRTGAPAVIPDDVDLLGLFAGPAETGAETSDKSRSPPDEDLLALLAAGNAPASAAARTDAASKDGDILALFEAKEDAAVPQSEQETMPGHPDILDMFGASDAKPDLDKKR